MITRSQRVRLGVFIILSIAVTIITITIIIAPKILEKRDIYYIAFRDVSVTGLQEGSSVKYQGIQVGYVSNISIDPEDIRRVIVEISLDQGTPIKEDTKAEIVFLGITGLKLIELKSGTNESLTSPPGSFILAGRSIAEEITGRAETLAEKTELVLNNLIQATDKTNADKFLVLVDTVSAAVAQINRFIKRNERPFHLTLQNTKEFSDNLDSLTFYAQSILKSWDAFAKSDTLNQIVNDFAEITAELKQAELVRLFREINKTLEQTNNMLSDVEISFAKSRSDLVYAIESFKETADNLNQFSRLISEDPSILIRGSEPKDAPDYDLEK